MGDATANGRPVKSADRTLDILEWLAQAGERTTLGQLARALDIPKSSLHALLWTMQRRGWVEIDATGSRFGLGVRALLVGTSYVDSDDAVAAAGETLDRLAATLGETIHYGRLDGADIVYLAKRQSVHPLRLYSAIGRRLPAHTTALGKALLAEQSLDEVRSRLGPDPARLTPGTITSWAGLVDELARVREHGYARDTEENTVGICCFAVTVGAAPRTDAISCSVPVARLTPDMQGTILDALHSARTRLTPDAPARRRRPASGHAGAGAATARDRVDHHGGQQHDGGDDELGAR